MRSLAFNALISSVLTFSMSASAQTASPAAPAVTAESGLYIKVGEAKVKKSLMAIPPFQYSGTPGSAKGALKIGQELYNTIRNNMDVSGFFDFIRPDAYLEDTSKVGLKPAPGEPGGFKYESWKQIGTDFLVRVGFRVLGDEVTVDTYTYYVPQAKLVLGKTYKAKTDDVRTLAHTFSNDLIKELTGQRGMFLSKVIVSRTTPKAGEKEIFLMDWDSGNSKQITKHRHISSSPAISADGKMIAYSTYTYHPKEKTRNRDLWTYDLSNGKRYLVSYRRGINSGASFMPNGKQLVYTMSTSGTAEIYRAGVDGKNVDQLTKSKSGELNVEPAVSPDGSKIAYSSDKSGYAMIYVMDANGSNSKRITFAGRYNSTPAWSPDGKKIAFAGFDAGHFDIFVMNADGTNLARLTSAKKANGKMSNNEYPTFSPDGRYVMFASDRTGKYQLYVVTVDGETERRITFDNFEYQQPRWSSAFE